MKALKIDGEKFGFLTVLDLVVSDHSSNGRKYKCVCVCGKEIIRTVSNLRSGGNRQSCGCKYSSYYEEEYDLSEKSIGDLLVLKRLGTHKSSKSVLYQCKCICGNIVELTSKAIQRRKIKNCGCKSIPGKKLTGNLSSLHKLISSYKANAKKKKLSFSLSENQCVALFNGNCYYCNDKPSRIFKHKKCSGEPLIYNGIDRIFNNKGYDVDNVVSCCTTCNYKKRETDHDKFLEWVSKIFNNRCNLKIDPRLDIAVG